MKKNTHTICLLSFYINNITIFYLLRRKNLVGHIFWMQWSNYINLLQSKTRYLVTDFDFRYNYYVKIWRNKSFMRQLKNYDHNSWNNNDKDRYTYFELHFKLTNIFVRLVTFKSFFIPRHFWKIAILLVQFQEHS